MCRNRYWGVKQQIEIMREEARKIANEMVELELNRARLLGKIKKLEKRIAEVENDDG